VGLPLDLLVYEEGCLRVTRFARIDESNQYMRMIRNTWGARLRQVFGEIPDPAWSSAEGQGDLGAERHQTAPVRAAIPPSLSRGAGDAQPETSIQQLAQQRPGQCPST